MKPYQPSNQIDKRGWQRLALTSGVGGITLGGFAFLTSFVAYLVVVLPILLGLVGGLLLQRAVYRGKVRNPLVAGVFAVVTGAVIYGTMHGIDYLVFRQNSTQEISRALNKSRDKSKQNPAAGMTVDQFLQEKTGAKGLGGFLRYRSQTGIVVNRSSLSIPVPPQLTWSYWGLEFLITSAIALGFAAGAARKPFCESCHSWYSAKDRLGRIKYQRLPEFLEAIDQAAATTASKFIDTLAKVYPPSLEVHLQSCSSCQNSEGILILSQAGVNKNGVIKLTPHSTGVISPAPATELAQAVRQRLEPTILNEQNNLGQNQILPQLALAQQERSITNKKTIYMSHNILPEQLTDLCQQLSQHPQIKQAYLVQKVVQNLPEIPFYVLGIMRKKHIIESATAQAEWESEFGNDLELGGDFGVVILNGDRRLQKQFQQVEASAIYTYTPSVKTPPPALPREL